MLKTLGMITLTLWTAAAFASPSPSADRIREQFWNSHDTKLQLAAEALGDDSIIEMFENLKKEKPTDPKVRRTIEKLNKEVK